MRTRTGQPGTVLAAPPPTSAGPDWWLVAILACAFVVRLGVVLQLHDHPLLRPSPQLDTGVYLELAHRVAGGDLLAGDRVFFVSPFYIYFVALVLLVTGGSTLAVQLLQVVLGTLAVWLIGETARTWFGRNGARIAAGLAALTGYFAFNESLLLQSAVDPFLTALGLWALARAWTGGHWRWHAAAGVALGLHALNRPNVLAWAAAAVAITAWTTAVQSRKSRVESREAERESPKSRMIPLVALLAGMLVVLGPVALRNYAVGGRLALVSSHGGLNFYIGNNPRADGTYRLVAGITPSISGQDRDMRRVAETALGRPVDDVAASSWFYEQAMEWIRSHPGTALRLFVRKVAYVFNAADIPLNDSYAYYATDESLLLRGMVVGPWLLLPLGLAGIWLARSRRAGAAWWQWVAFVPVYALSVAVFFVTGRYRLPLLAPLCVTSAGCVVSLASSIRAVRSARHEASGAGASGGFTPLVAPALLVVGLGVVTNWNLGIDNGLAGWRAEMVLYYVDARQDEQARALLARTEPLYPNRGLLLYRVGRAYLARGDAQEALSLFDRGLAVDPGRGELQVAAGEALLQSGRAAEAIPRLEAARRTPAVEDRATLALARAEVMAGRVGEGLALLGSLREPGRLDAGAQLAAGQLALENGSGPVAEPFLRRAVQMAPENAEAHEAFGLALAMQGRQEEALGVLERACQLNPGSASSRLNLAILYAEMNRVADARRAAEDAVRLRPDYDRARQFLAAIAGR